MKIERRDFIKFIGFCFLLLFTGGRFRYRHRKREGKEKGFIRPPGAIVEDDFVYQCVRCGECIKVCPTACLVPVAFSEGLIEWGTPRVFPRKAGCIRCLNCAKVCPSGAIQEIDIEEVKMGTAKISRDRCLVWHDGKDCYICLEYCPVGAVFKDSRERPVVDPKKCVGCGICEENCPVLGEAAINVSNKGEIRFKLKGGKNV